LPEGSKLGELKLIRALKRHHQAHHNPALMNDYNFNITFPIWDWVKGRFIVKWNRSSFKAEEMFE